MSGRGRERRLAAILAADVVGYSRLIGADEAGTLDRLRALRRDVVDPLMTEHGGRVFKTTGDGLLAEFPSAVQALRCAITIQERQRPDAAGLQLRIGLHQGDVVIEDNDLLGDGVNIAARIEPLAEPGGICISARVREDAAGKMPLEVDDLGTPELKNIVQSVRVFRVRFGAPERPALALPDSPSLAVLPFTNLSGDPEQEYFADGVVEDITSALSRTGWLFVIARNSAFTYKSRAVDVRQVGRELAVRYVLEGSVRRAGERVRITCQLVEAATGHHVWTDRFDGEIADIFDLQDRITESVVGGIEPGLRSAEIARATAKPTENLDAYDLYLRALPRHYATDRPGMGAAIGLLRRALEIDPNFVRAKGLLSMVLAMRVSRGWGEAGDQDEAIALARETFVPGMDDPDALSSASTPLSLLAGDYPAAFAALRRALQLHPNSAAVLSSLGHVHCFASDPEPAIGCFERAMRLSPLDPGMGHMLMGLGRAHLLAGHTVQALPLLQRCVQEMPHNLAGHRALILALTRLGRPDEARAAAARSLEVVPDHIAGLATNTIFNAKFNAELQQALLAAGVPE